MHYIVEDENCAVSDCTPLTINKLAASVFIIKRISYLIK